MIAEVPDVYPLGMTGFMIWDANSTDIGIPAIRRASVLWHIPHGEMDC